MNECSRKEGGREGRKERREGREGGGRREDVSEYLEGESSCHYISVRRDDRNIVQNDSVLTLHHLKQQQQQRK